MSSEQTMTATAFKARCLELFDQLAARKLDRVTITKRGRIVAVLSPPEPDVKEKSLHGCMRGSVIVPAGVDLTLPVLDEPLEADEAAGP